MDLITLFIRYQERNSIEDILRIASRVSIIINFVIVALFFICYFHQIIYGIMGMFIQPKKWDEAKKNHKYAYIISARNEEKVIGHLIDSILEQDYPKELMSVIVVADNCTDSTAKVASEHGATVFERFDDKYVGKGFALDYIFTKLLKDPKYNDIEAFFVFDADNLLSKTFTYEMNKLFDSGIQVATGFREAKNFSASWVSAGQAISFYRESLLIHRSRSKLNKGTYVSGTGFYVSREVVKQNNGWKFYAMIEDIEFSIDCAYKDILIGYCDQAVFYDEQPVLLRDSLNQRLRWCKGSLQCCHNYESKLMKKCLTKFSTTKFELMMHVSPLPMICFIWTIIFMLFNGILAACGIISFIIPLISFIAFFGSICLIAFIHALTCVHIHRNQIKLSRWKKFWYCVTFPPLMGFYLLLYVVALFVKVKWKEIPHTDEVGIESLEKNDSNL